MKTQTSFPAPTSLKLNGTFVRGLWLNIRMMEGEGRETAACLAVTDIGKGKGIS